jgi:hypothetical protein
MRDVWVIWCFCICVFRAVSSCTAFRFQRKLDDFLRDSADVREKDIASSTFDSLERECPSLRFLTVTYRNFQLKSTSSSPMMHNPFEQEHPCLPKLTLI